MPTGDTGGKRSDKSKENAQPNKRGLSKWLYLPGALLNLDSGFEILEKISGSKEFREYADNRYDIKSALNVLKQRQEYENKILKHKVDALVLEKKMNQPNVTEKMKFRALRKWWKTNVWREILERSEVSCRKSIQRKLDRCDKEPGDFGTYVKAIRDANEKIVLWGGLNATHIDSLAKELSYYTENSDDKVKLQGFEKAANNLKAYVEAASELRINTQALTTCEELNRLAAKAIQGTPSKNKDNILKKYGLKSDDENKYRNTIIKLEGTKSTDKNYQYNDNKNWDWWPNTWAGAALKKYPEWMVRHPKRAVLSYLLPAIVGGTAAGATAVGLGAAALGLGAAAMLMPVPTGVAYLLYRQQMKAIASRAETPPVSDPVSRAETPPEGGVKNEEEQKTDLEARRKVARAEVDSKARAVLDAETLVTKTATQVETKKDGIEQTVIDEVTTAVNAADTSEKMQSLMESMNKAVLDAETLVTKTATQVETKKDGIEQTVIDEVTTAVNAADTSEKMQSLMESMNKAVLDAETLVTKTATQVETKKDGIEQTVIDEVTKR